MAIETFNQVKPGLREFCRHEFALAADLGQANDYTAIAVIQYTSSKMVTQQGHESPGNERFEVRHLQRLPLGMSYIEQFATIGALLTRPPLPQGCDFLIDETGVGRPCGDLAESAGLKPKRVTITGGDRQYQKGPRTWSVPKGLLISALDARLHSRELVISDQLTEADILKEELRNFHRHVSAAGRTSFEARTGKHDDLVLAVAIALWNFVGRPKRPPAQVGRYGIGTPIRINK